jgi:hypothetical protein
MTDRTSMNAMQLRAERRSAAAATARAWAREYVDSNPTFPRPRELRTWLRTVAKDTGQCDTDLWIATRDELRAQGKWPTRGEMG